MQKQKIETKAAPAAIGPYSQAVSVGDMVFYSGQIPLVPETGILVEGGIEAQTRQVMANMRAVLHASGLDYQDIVKTTIYLLDMNDFAAVNAIYGECFADIPPARACVQVAGLPKGASIEIDWIAVAK